MSFLADYRDLGGPLDMGQGVRAEHHLAPEGDMRLFARELDAASSRELAARPARLLSAALFCALALVGATTLVGPGYPPMPAPPAFHLLRA